MNCTCPPTKDCSRNLCTRCSTHIGGNPKTHSLCQTCWSKSQAWKESQNLKVGDSVKFLVQSADGKGYPIKLGTLCRITGINAIQPRQREYLNDLPPEATLLYSLTGFGFNTRTFILPDTELELVSHLDNREPL